MPRFFFNFQNANKVVAKYDVRQELPGWKRLDSRAAICPRNNCRHPQTQFYHSAGRRHRHERKGQKVIAIRAKHVLRETLKLDVEPPRRSDEVQSYLGIVRVRHGVPSATVPKTTGIS